MRRQGACVAVGSGEGAVGGEPAKGPVGVERVGIEELAVGGVAGECDVALVVAQDVEWGVCRHAGLDDDEVALGTVLVTDPAVAVRGPHEAGMGRRSVRIRSHVLGDDVYLDAEFGPGDGDRLGNGPERPDLLAARIDAPDRGASAAQQFYQSEVLVVPAVGDVEEARTEVVLPEEFPEQVVHQGTGHELLARILGAHLLDERGVGKPHPEAEVREREDEAQRRHRHPPHRRADSCARDADGCGEGDVTGSTLRRILVVGGGHRPHQGPADGLRAEDEARDVRARRCPPVVTDVGGCADEQRGELPTVL